MVILDEVVRQGPRALPLAVAAWGLAVAGGAAAAPLALDVLGAPAAGTGRTAALRRLHVAGFLLAVLGAGAALGALGTPARVARLAGALRLDAPLPAATAAIGTAAVLHALAALLAGRSLGRLAATGAAAAGVVAGLAPAVHLAALPARDLFGQGGAGLQQALTAALAGNALLAGVADDVLPDPRWRRSEILLLVATAAGSLVEEMPAAGAQPVLLEAARHAMTSATLAPWTLGVALGAGTLLPLLLVLRAPRSSLAGVLAVLGRLAWTASFVRAGMSLVGA